jgi:hypothetical protein
MSAVDSAGSKVEWKVELMADSTVDGSVVSTVQL